jgi:hypothetical protein
MHNRVPFVTADETFVRKLRRSELAAEVFSLKEAVG